LTIFQSIFLSVCLFLLPLTVLFYFALAQISENVAFGNLEVTGLRYQRPLLRLVKAAGDYRLARLQGAASEGPEQEVETLLREFEAADKEIGADLQFTPAMLEAAGLSDVGLSALKSRWSALRQASGDAHSKAAGEAYDGFVNSIRGAISHSGDTSNLTLDPEMDSYYLADVVSVVGGQTLQRIAEAAQYLTPALRSNQLSQPERTRMAVVAAALKESDVDRITGDLDTAIKENQKAKRGPSVTLKPTLERVLPGYKADLQHLLDLLSPSNGRVPADAELQAAAHEASARSLELCEKSSAELASVLSARLAGFSANRRRMIAWMLAALAIAFLTFIAVVRAITRPLNVAIDHLSLIARGQFSGSLPAEYRERGDEIGSLARGLEAMSAGLREMIGEIAGGVAILSTSSAELLESSKQMSDGSSQVSTKAQSVAAAAEELSANAVSVAAGVEQTTTNLANVASATEQMTNTVGEIAMNSEKARRITANAGGQAERMNAQMARLGEAARAIGKVSETIAEISSQTNLLALNATIEAARAGSAGKGFAVVANEIKTLAQQAASATEDIKARIGEVQSSAREGVAEIEKIAAVIVNVGDIVNSIAAAIEQQAVATKEIAHHIAEASAGVADANSRVSETSQASGEIARDIARVESAARDMSEGSGRVRENADGLASVSEHLKLAMDRFHI
jgi:methyl-accepting chemotaxis protein